MATIHHHYSSAVRRPRRHSYDYSSLPSSTTSSLSLKHYPISSFSPHMITFPFSSTSINAASTTTPTTSPDTTFSLDVLQQHLASGDFRQADDETRRLLIVLAGEAAIKRGYVYFTEVQFIPKDDLKAIDELWKKFSNGRYGYSVQKKIWVKVNKDFTRFFIKVGWMKKLDTEIEQFNYRAFPNEFMWEFNMNDEKNNPPEGHLPLTNALRGTQLLTCIFSHPAFHDDEDNEEGSDKEVDIANDNTDNKKSRFASLRDRLFKPNYNF
ncbi:unnamed protein product [Amaranthus hypochondriacus]